MVIIIIIDKPNAVGTSDGLEGIQSRKQRNAVIGQRDDDQSPIG